MFELLARFWHRKPAKPVVLDAEALAARSDYAALIVHLLSRNGEITATFDPCAPKNGWTIRVTRNSKEWYTSTGWQTTSLEQGLTHVMFGVFRKKRAQRCH